MFPLSYVLFFWIALMVLYFFVSLFSVIQMTRFAISGSMVYISTFGFIIVASLVILGTVVYGLRVDWSQSVDLVSIFSSAPPPTL